MEITGESVGDDTCVCIGNKHQSLACFQIASFTCFCGRAAVGVLVSLGESQKCEDRCSTSRWWHQQVHGKPSFRPGAALGGDSV